MKYNLTDLHILYNDEKQTFQIINQPKEWRGEGIIFKGKISNFKSFHILSKALPELDISENVLYIRGIDNKEDKRNIVVESRNDYRNWKDKLTLLGVRMIDKLAKSTDSALHKSNCKLDLTHIPPFALEGMARVMNKMQGEGKKYPLDNWERGMNYREILGSIKRHILEVEKGNFTDMESGEPHLFHVMVDCFFMQYYIEHYPEKNNLPRWKKDKK